MVFVVLGTGAPEGSPAVVLVLKRLRRRGHSFKSHPTDWEKQGIEPATPGLHDIGLSPIPRRNIAINNHNDAMILYVGYYRPIQYKTRHNC